MKINWIFLLVIMYGLFAACEGGTNAPVPASKLKKIAGEYIGKAQVICTTMQFSDNGDSTVTSTHDTIIEKITVSIIDEDKSIVSITRNSYSRLGACYFSYDIGAPNSEYTLSENFVWQYSYTYDKVWNSRIQFDPENQSLTGNMLQKDQFGTEGPDNQGNWITIFNTYEYSVSAERQK